MNLVHSMLFFCTGFFFGGGGGGGEGGTRVCTQNFVVLIAAIAATFCVHNSIAMCNALLDLNRK